jgi:urease accessory protein
MAAVETSVAGARWRGALRLSFAATRGRTHVAKRLHEGPFCIQQPFYPGDGACHVYLLHPPGGLAGGDELVLDADAAPGAAVLLTTPASTKFYRSDGLPSTQIQTLRVAAGAALEWLPQDTILFGGSRAAIRTDVELDADAHFIGWEMTVLGRPLSGDRYATGSLEQRTALHVNGEPLLLERLRFTANDDVLSANWGLAGFAVQGSMYAWPADPAVLELARRQLGTAAATFDELHAHTNRGAAPDRRCGATLLERLLVIRCLARQPEALRSTFALLWAALRPAVIGRAPCAPRIWNT